MADKKVSIKSATDQQLDELLKRLRKEREVQSLIADIKRNSEERPYNYDGYFTPTISTEAPIESLYHFGVLGMRWGRRKSGLGNRVVKKPKSPGSKDYQQSRKLIKKGTKNLSTQELKDLTQRLQLEKQYKDLNPTKIKKGMNVVKAVTAAGTTVASLYALSKTPLAQDIIKAMAKAG
jgi:hypothetical protein